MGADVIEALADFKRDKVKMNHDLPEVMTHLDGLFKFRLLKVPCQ